MIIKKAEYKKVMKEVNERVSDDIYGCDLCKKEFFGNDNLEITVFNHEEENSKRHQFCSWECVLEFLPSVKSNYFVNLPYLSFDSEKEGSRASDFLKLIGGIKNKL